MLVHFRERIDINLVNKINRKIVEQTLEIKEEVVKEKKSESEDSKSEATHRGKLILDASCAPADIGYPTDLGLWLYENKKQKIEDRIVSLTQPHIRPIIRGKAGKRTEFGAKLSASCYNGYVFLDHISWDNFNESCDLKSVIEDFKIYTGYYPESVHVDKIYRTRENRDWCKKEELELVVCP